MEHYILVGKTPVKIEDFKDWTLASANQKNTVAYDFIYGVRVSTVFLGIDHGFKPGDKPVLFETMVFGGKHDQFQERYCTWDEAESGHKTALKMVKPGVLGMISYWLKSVFLGKR